MSDQKEDRNSDQDDDFQPPTKMRRIGSKKVTTSTSQLDSRFAEKSSIDKVQEYSKAWRSNRNKDAPQEEQVPTDILSTKDSQLLQEWLICFLLEARKTNGDNTEAIRLIFFDKADHCFEGLSNALDKVCRELRQEGLGTIRKGSSVFTAEEEDSLWKKGVIGLDTPVKLLRAVFFYNGINFALRGGAEHRSLKWSQWWTTDLRHLNKKVTRYANEEAGDHCHLKILDLYLSKLPAGFSREAFYYKPLSSTPSFGPWYSKQ
ncbi:zinc finger MYM-type protein 2-like, partial [Corticium candelabrum]|uniref:zinc finger MYM-type protein 2-like n=1 Tax=Corticium candelabrum TaxID=121492 RepID=UPI002E267432